MIKTLIIWILGIAMLSIWGTSLWAKPRPESHWMQDILTKEDSQIIEPPKDVNPLVKGTQTAVQSEKHKITDISNTKDKFNTQEEATNKTLDMIHRLINWALWMAAFVALIVVIYGGFQMLTAAWDDAKFKSWKAAMKKVAIGLIWIWVSWMIVSLIFRFIGVIVS